MATTMHRLQISLPEWQHQFLVQRARRDGVSVAEIIRQLIERAASPGGAGVVAESIWEISGIGEDPHPLVGGVPVSEAPDLYLAGLEPAPPPKSRRRPPRRRRR